LGFTVHFENSFTVVAHIKPAGQAEVSGILPGSALTTVNGVDVTELTHEERITLMRTDQRPLCMRFARRGVWDAQTPASAATVANEQQPGWDDGRRKDHPALTLPHEPHRSTALTHHPPAPFLCLLADDAADAAAAAAEEAVKVRAPPVVKEEPVQNVFLYSEDMAFDALAKRAGIKLPSAATAVYLPEHRLTFTRRGFDEVEPVFANIEGRMGAAVPAHGGMVSLKESVVAKLDKFMEGEAWCKRATVKVCTYADEEDEAITWVPKTAHVSAPKHPSERFKRLLVKRATALGLKAEYVASLDAVETLDAAGKRGPSNATTATVTSVQLKKHTAAAEAVYTSVADIVFDITAGVKVRTLASTIGQSLSRRVPCSGLSRRGGVDDCRPDL
jgi:hypothetical protein